MSDSLQTETITEGSTELVVPAQDEPKKFPAFFNPQGRFVRDVSMVCYDAHSTLVNRRDLVFADSLSGAGSRGVRVAKETQGYVSVILNDISSTSIGLAKRSAELNGVTEKCKFSNMEVCSFLSLRQENDGDRFDVVDVDPFGTPSPFVDCALRSTKDGGLLSVSATDSAVLCGVYPRVAFRKYLGLPLRTDYSHEIGIRLMFGLLAITAMRFEIGITPVFSHHDRHYFRTYCTVHAGNRYSRENEGGIGYAMHCFRCGFRNVTSHANFFSHQKIDEVNYASTQCPACHASRLRIGGPLWVGNIQSEKFVSQCAKLSTMSLFEQELDLPLYYDLAETSDKMGVRTPKILDVISELRKVGHSASRTRLNQTAVRTLAPLPELQKILKELAR